MIIIRIYDCGCLYESNYDKTTIEGMFLFPSLNELFKSEYNHEVTPPVEVIIVNDTFVSRLKSPYHRKVHFWRLGFLHDKEVAKTIKSIKEYYRK